MISNLKKGEIGKVNESRIEYMGMDALILLREVLNAQRVEVRMIHGEGEGFPVFDNGIREQLFMDFDYGRIKEQMIQNCKERTIYYITDLFGVHYIVFRKPEDGGAYILIGPYLGLVPPDAREIVEKVGIDLFHVQTLQSYYYEIPVIDNIEQIVLVFVHSAFPTGNFRIERTGLLLQEDYEGEKTRLADLEQIPAGLLEERYRIEDALVEAVGQGDITKAYFYLGKFGHFRVLSRSGDFLRDSRNMMIVLNTLFRKEVRLAKVHPAYIDEVSGNLAKRIENTKSGAELNRILTEMVRKYCLLVQNHSLRGYSELMERVLNYIDFHLEEPMGLQVLAEQFSLNPSYLSRSFKKETGKTLTDYINEKRIEKSLVYLAATNLPIQEVAAKVGVYDENYFSRMFKKIKERTPREYRNMITGDGVE
ncbi:MAG: AraC family transcriptional regulator [Acetatifactor sp.]|nr:AraC family transcriptional regulator [Acetatifactor sp.]